ncbi:hypothetical protein NHE_0583 [Neorickettsia helminthoeca str. Oregon]|uniref:Uncharacterized protein n=1 Tax=Neorickettsia helminthoeca str. Oregon TaxID=1286528 RepID=X5H4P5_9RICK|nr:hypothetical protein [Neorickettsia helminthoeca]AHX11521.1 hypothetical protein NHE_0583 [Neorickettsia helminthoeca str. Oregon]
MLPDYITKEIVPKLGRAASILTRSMHMQGGATDTRKEVKKLLAEVTSDLKKVKSKYEPDLAAGVRDVYGHISAALIAVPGKPGPSGCLMSDRERGSSVANCHKYMERALALTKRLALQSLPDKCAPEEKELVYKLMAYLDSSLPSGKGGESIQQLLEGAKRGLGDIMTDINNPETRDAIGRYAESHLLTGGSTQYKNPSEYVTHRLGIVAECVTGYTLDLMSALEQSTRSHNTPEQQATVERGTGALNSERPRESVTEKPSAPTLEALDLAASPEQIEKAQEKGDEGIKAKPTLAERVRTILHAGNPLEMFADALARVVGTLGLMVDKMKSILPDVKGRRASSSTRDLREHVEGTDMTMEEVCDTLSLTAEEVRELLQEGKRAQQSSSHGTESPTQGASASTPELITPEPIKATKVETTLETFKAAVSGVSTASPSQATVVEEKQAVPPKPSVKTKPKAFTSPGAEDLGSIRAGLKPTPKPEPKAPEHSQLEGLQQAIRGLKHVSRPPEGGRSTGSQSMSEALSTALSGLKGVQQGQSDKGASSAPGATPGQPDQGQGASR